MLKKFLKRILDSSAYRHHSHYSSDDSRKWERRHSSHYGHH
ncbi:hypothetical protein [Bacillus smithii]|nr:hypothetical protein [Bacillus smithii]AKP47176.1 hypothetical protein BSM4216_1918 [Bacillus smithii]MED4884006.1 hypothetical protein [Bacillus smithii]MED4927853.1 hypothetical protein [Bacillus smithii]